MRCPECGCIHKNNRVDTDNFLCHECGHSEDAQLVGALNIKYYGELLYKSNVPHDDWTTGSKRRSVQQLIEEYSDQATEVLPTLLGPLKSEVKQSRFLFD
jgi:hypothetical protein